MARVTKINVGGTNYDIAHEGELRNSGFEVVTELPTTGLFAGREVMYNGKKYVYSSGWKEEITANTMYEANLLWGGRNIVNSYSPIDSAMMSELSANVMAYPNPAGISVEYSRDGGVTWQDYQATNKQKVDIFTTSGGLYCGKSEPDGLLATVGYQLRITITPINCGLYTYLNKIIMNISTTGTGNCWCTFSGLKAKEVAVGNEDDTYYNTFVNKAKIDGWTGYNVINFNSICTALNTTSPSSANDYYRLRLIFGYDKTNSSPYAGLYIKQLRFFGNGRWNIPSNLATNNHLYTYDWKQNALFPAKVESKEVINFDVNNIEPTQTGNVSKTSTWLWQYLTQAVNWLKANNVRLSAYNTKIAALEQADSDNNALSQSVSTDLTELSNGLAAVARSGSYNDLLNRPDLVFSNIGGNVATAQITDGSITNAKLANSSMTLNGINCELGDTKTLPCIISFDGTLYKVRIYQNWLQIYHAGTWVNKYYLLSSLPTECRYITDLSDPSWYDESVTEYELDNSATEQLLLADSSTNIANWIEAINANQITFNSSVIASKRFNKGALDNIISNLKGKGYSVFVENDIDTILSSGNDWVISIKIKRFNNTYKAIIECYVAR